MILLLHLDRWVQIDFGQRRHDELWSLGAAFAGVWLGRMLWRRILLIVSWRGCSHLCLL